MSRDDYQQQLGQARDPIGFLRKHSRRPGPRANLELLQAAADVGDEKAFRRWIAAGAGDAPTDEFVAMCGVVGLVGSSPREAPSTSTSCARTPPTHAGEFARRSRLLSRESVITAWMHSSR